MQHNYSCRVGKTTELNVFTMLSEDQETNPGGVALKEWVKWVQNILPFQPLGNSDYKYLFMVNE